MSGRCRTSSETAPRVSTAARTPRKTTTSAEWGVPARRDTLAEALAGLDDSDHPVRPRAPDLDRPLEQQVGLGTRVAHAEDPLPDVEHRRRAVDGETPSAAPRSDPGTNRLLPMARPSRGSPSRCSKASRTMRATPSLGGTSDKGTSSSGTSRR